jgi:release factor glutamine methyltransferase
LKVKDAIRYIIDSIQNIYGPGEAESIAFIVLEFAGFPRKRVFLMGENEISTQYEELVIKLVKELKTSKPIQYILGETEFFGLKFLINGNVLIPRQETEELVQKIIRDNKKPDPVILDLGTGSGCISVSLAKNIPSAKVYATDISPEALMITNENAKLNSVKIHTIADDMLHPELDNKLKFDIIVSNPPYVRDSEKQFIKQNVLNYEPATALFVRDDNPLGFYRAISGIALQKLFSGGLLYVEINENFGFEVADLFRASGFSDPEIIRDIHGKNRIVKAIKK